MPRALSNMLHLHRSHSEISVSSRDVSSNIIPKNDGHRNFLTKCAGWKDDKVSVDLTPELWSKIRSAKSTDIEQSFTDATLLTGRHSSAAASNLELLNESDSAGGLTPADLAKIAKEQKESREFLCSFQEPTCFSARGIPKGALKEYARRSNGCDMTADYQVYKQSQMFREHIVKFANISDPERRNVALKEWLDSNRHFHAENIIALYRLS